MLFKAIHPMTFNQKSWSFGVKKTAQKKHTKIPNTCRKKVVHLVYKIKNKTITKIQKKKQKQRPPKILK